MSVCLFIRDSCVGRRAWTWSPSLFRETDNYSDRQFSAYDLYIFCLPLLQIVDSDPLIFKISLSLLGSVYPGVVFCRRLCGVSVIRRYSKNTWVCSRVPRVGALVDLWLGFLLYMLVARAWRMHWGHAVKASRLGKSSSMARETMGGRSLISTTSILWTLYLPGP